MGVAPQTVTLGHVGLFTRDLEGMLHFFRDVLGFVLTDRGERICFLSRDPTQHHQVVLCPGRPEGVSDMVQQLSFKVDSLDEVKAIHGRLVSAGVTKMENVTHGNAWSIYFRDPENNRLEFYCDTPWHIPQPFRRDIDYSEPVDRIYEKTKAICEAVPGFKPMRQYEQELAKRLETAKA
jgi:catechol 2,3-dioxygenase-like lactoylglutathione lyase family enzyme